MLTRTPTKHHITQTEYNSPHRATTPSVDLRPTTLDENAKRQQQQRKRKLLRRQHRQRWQILHRLQWQRQRRRRRYRRNCQRLQHRTERFLLGLLQADLREDEHLADVLALRARVLHAVSDWMCYYFGAVRGGLDGLEERVVWAMALMLVDDDDDGDDDDDDDDCIVYYLRERWTKALGRLAAGDHGGKDSGVFLETGGEWRKWVAQFAGSTEKAPETLDFITRLPWT